MKGDKINMPYKRKKTYTITLDEADKDKLETFSKRRKASMKEIVGFYIQLDTDYDLWSTDWKDKVKEADDRRARYTGLDGACGNMTFAKEDYICVRAVLGKPPSIKKLSDELEEALKICAICEEDTRKKLDRDLTLERVHELEVKLKERATEKFKIPQCNSGARLDNEGLAFEGCPRSIGKPVSIEGYCKKINGGRGCDWLKIRLIGVGAKT